jgi:uncharacterized protein (DUF302 family)
LPRPWIHRFQQAVERTVAKLKDHGFGVLTKIDVQATLKEKIAAASWRV